MLPALALPAGCRQQPTSPVPDPLDSAAPSGSLRIEQLDLDGGWIGEAALILGPDGTTVMIDVGNSQHSNEVRQALQEHGVSAVDHVILTHDDSDHVGGFDALFEGPEAIPILGEVVRQDLDDLPRTLPLGGGAELTVFLASG